MSINLKVSVAYFSPTNGTKKVATLLADSINTEYKLINLTNAKERLNKIDFSKEELLIAAAPVYASKIPQVNGLYENLNGNNTPCVIMAAYGNRHYDDTLAQMKSILEKRGFICIAAISPIIPHIYSEKLGANRPDENDIVIINDFADKVLEKLNKNKIESVNVPGEENPKEYPVNPGGKNTKILDRKVCNNCKVCVTECPMECINEETLEIDNKLCINCMKCSKICPTSARKFDSTEIGKYLEGNYLRRREIEVFI